MLLTPSRSRRLNRSSSPDPVSLLASSPPPLANLGPQEQASREARAAEFLRASILEAESRFHLSRRGVVLLFGDLVAGKYD